MNPRFLRRILISAAIPMFLSIGLKAQFDANYTLTNITCHNSADGKMKIDVISGSGSYNYICMDSAYIILESFGPTGDPTHTFLNRLPQRYRFIVEDIATGSAEIF